MIKVRIVSSLTYLEDKLSLI